MQEISKVLFSCLYTDKYLHARVADYYVRAVTVCFQNSLVFLFNLLKEILCDRCRKPSTSSISIFICLQTYALHQLSLNFRFSKSIFTSRKVWEKVTDSLFSLPAFNIFRLSTLQSWCKSAIVSSVVVAFVVSCEQWLHLCSTINLARFSAINLNCTSFCSCDKNEQVEVESCSLPPAMPLIYDRPTWFIIHSSLFLSLTYSLSLFLCVCFPAGVATGSFWLCAASGVVTRDSWRAYQQMIEVSS